jgi:hypothetical protein
LRAKFEGDELEALKTKIALNLREKFRERDDDKKEGHGDKKKEEHGDKKKEKDHGQMVGEHDGDRKLDKKEGTHGKNETRKNETHIGKHNETKKNETKAKHNETKRNETHSKRNETRKDEGHGKKLNETEKNGGDSNLGERNETHPEGPRIGENEDEEYFNQHKNGTNQTDKYRTVFLQAVVEPATPNVEQETGLPWYYTVGLAVAGLAIIGFVAFFIKKTCYKKDKIDENFHKERQGAAMV